MSQSTELIERLRWESKWCTLGAWLLAGLSAGLLAQAVVKFTGGHSGWSVSLLFAALIGLTAFYQRRIARLAEAFALVVEMVGDDRPDQFQLDMQFVALVAKARAEGWYEEDPDWAEVDAHLERILHATTERR